MRAFIFRLFHLGKTNSRPSRQRSYQTRTIMSSSATAGVLYAVTVNLSTLTGAVPEEAKEKRHHLKDGKGFTNPWESFQDRNAWGFIKLMGRRRITGAANVPDTTPPTVPVRKPTFLPSRATQTLRATWLGHACYLVEFPSGFRVLFDPVFSERCSPFTWLGPKRYTEVPCQIEEIPIVDAVVISHNHYDHMDHPTLKRIQAQHPNAHYFVPLKNKKWFLESGFSQEQVTELDWWEERDMKLQAEKPEVGAKDGTSPPGSQNSIMARISCLPCQHQSARSAFDRCHTLWASWSVESGGKKVWFGGDTGYRAVPELPKDVDDYGPDHAYPHCPAFKDIGKFRGPFDLGLIPIGAYEPRVVMSSIHANPFDSVNIFKDTQCRRAMGIHWGTWVLTEEDVMEPPRVLKKALARGGLAEKGVFDTCDIGETREFP